MDDTKSLVESRSFWSAVLVLAGMIGATYHIDWLSSWAGNPDTINQIMMYVGLFGTVVFRLIASKKITSVLPPMTPPAATANVHVLLPLALVAPLFFLGGCQTVTTDGATTPSVGNSVGLMVSNAMNDIRTIAARLDAIEAHGNALAAEDVAYIQAHMPQAAKLIIDADNIAQLAAATGTLAKLPDQKDVQFATTALDKLAATPLVVNASNNVVPQDTTVLATSIGVTLYNVRNATRATVSATAAAAKATAS